MDDLGWLQLQFGQFKDEIRHDLAEHEQRDGDQFAALRQGQIEMDVKLMKLVTARAEQVGAAQAIAELAERRASKNTWIVSLIAVACSLFTICIQKHWFGL